MSTVHWPAGHEPAGAAIHEVNSGRSVATPELVWAWLVRPDLWSGRGSRGHHAWTLLPEAGGTSIHTEETQRGLPSRILGPFLRPAMRREHQKWVDNLAQIAASGKGPAA
jgi:hypothetical protein